MGAVRFGHRSALLIAACLTGAQAPTGLTPPGRFGPPWPEDRRAVNLTIPVEYLPYQVPFRPGETSTVLLTYPSMAPWRPVPGCKSFCDGQVMLLIRSGAPSELNRAVWAFRRRQEQLKDTASQPGYQIRALPPEQGFDEGWLDLVLTPSSILTIPTESRIQIRSAQDGTPQAWADCKTRYPTPLSQPNCTVEVTLPGVGALQISMSYNAKYWPEQAKLQAAVERLVGSWR